MKRERWEGGYIHTEKDGRPLFIIERQVGGKRFHVSTRAHSWSAARKHLERFEADPRGYRPEGIAGELVLTNELIAEFVRAKIEKGRTPRHAKEMGRHLGDWQEVFKGRDLRQVSLRHDIVPALDKWKSQQHRIIALKSLYGWLRKVRFALTAKEDPTLDLTVPQAEPEKMRRRKAVEWERVKAAFEHLAPAYRDVLQLLAATGWHVTELERFVREPVGELVAPLRPIKDKHGRDVLAVAITRHKGKKLTRTPLVFKEHVDAAARLKEKGTVPRKLNEAIEAACKAANVDTFTLGVMRHSVATWAVELGAHEQDTSEYLQHEDKRTTKRHYIDLAIPTQSIPTRVL